MAIGASLGRWRIEEDLFAIDGFEELVASSAGDVTMLAFQGERCALVVIEGRRLPLARVMAVVALRNFVREELGELAAVDVLVALLAFLGRLFEVHVGHLGFEIRRLVAVDASDGAMRTHQRE